MARVLIIDDSATLRAFVRHALETDGHEVIELDVFVSLPSILREAEPDVVLLDLKMPGLDGLEMGNYVRRFESRPTDIIIYSSASAAERESAARSVRAAAHLEKTADSTALRECVAGLPSGSRGAGGGMGGGMRTISMLLLAPLAVSLLQLGCNPLGGCDEGEGWIDGRCQPLSEGPMGDTSTDAGGQEDTPAADQVTGDVPAEADGTAAPDADPFAGLGDVCSDGENHSDCPSTAPYCAVQPGGTEGYCTPTGCAEDAGVCPDDWGCMDLSMFDASLPSICTPP